MHTRSHSSANPVRFSALARIGVAAVALLIGACQAPAAPSSSAPPVAIASPGPSNPNPSVPAPSADPSSGPVATPRPTPTPTWSKPITVKGLAGCHAVVAAVDEGGRQHLAATCGTEPSGIRYAVSIDGRTWTTTPLEAPAGRHERDPQLAFSGDTIYLAYTRLAPADGGCGDDGLDDLGVWYRTRSLPGGDWSEPAKIGATADHLQAFRVHGGTVHATVANEKSNETAYVVVDGTSTNRYKLANATGWTSLRVGDDGKGRIAYESATGIGYGMVEGSQFVGTTIANEANAQDPVLTLAPGNAAYLLWTETFSGGGCAEPDPLPSFGTYFATNVSGSWVASRLTRLVGGASMTIDPATGELHVLVGDYRRTVYFHRAAGATKWLSETISRDHPSSAVIRQDPTTGALVAVFVADLDPEHSRFEVQVMVRR